MLRANRLSFQTACVIPDGRAEEVWNCRCTLVTSFEEDEDFSDIKERANKLDNQSYDEWKNERKQKSKVKS